jgi:hypothetical protein
VILLPLLVAHCPGHEGETIDRQELVYRHVPQVKKTDPLSPFKSTASGRVTPRGYADPGRMLMKSFIPFRVSRFPLETIIENGKRETKKLQIQLTPRLQAWLVTGNSCFFMYDVSERLLFAPACVRMLRIDLYGGCSQ